MCALGCNATGEESSSFDHTLLLSRLGSNESGFAWRTSFNCPAVSFWTKMGSKECLDLHPQTPGDVHYHALPRELWSESHHLYQANFSIRILWIGNYWVYGGCCIRYRGQVDLLIGVWQPSRNIYKLQLRRSFLKGGPLNTWHALKGSRKVLSIGTVIRAVFPRLMFNRLRYMFGLIWAHSKK